jgi:plastocyanin
MLRLKERGLLDMKCSWAMYAAPLLLTMTVSCGRQQEQTTQLPPAPPSAPAANAPAAAPGQYEVAAIADGGGISGAITLSGAIPKLPPHKTDKDPQVCGTAPRDSEKLIVNKSGGVKNAVVMVLDVKRGKPMPDAAKNAEIDQKKCEYTPHVQVMALNSEISMKNSDPVLHNVQFFQGDNSLFNIAQPVQGQVTKHVIDKPGPLYVECAVHGWMQGQVIVVDNPYYAVTDENGKFSIPELPPGKYQVKIWHEYLGEQTKEITVAAKMDTALNMDLKDMLAAKNAPAAAPGAPGAAGAPADAAAGANAKPAGNEVVIKMTEVQGSAGTTYRFDPQQLTIKVGTTVRWVNASGEDGPRHTSTDDPDWETPQTPAVLPAGAPKWRTKFLTNGLSETHTFTVPGKYQYFCETHGPYGMVASITVEP